MKKNKNQQITIKEPNVTNCNKPVQERIELKHDGICHKMVIDELKKHEDSVLNTISPKIRDNGFIAVNDNDHRHVIKPVEDCWAASFIPGVALASSEMDNDYAACAIVNTLDNGFVYATVNKDSEIEAIGPVVTTCVIGNASKPQGIYIPFNNRDAIMTGVGFALDYMASIEGVQPQSKEIKPMEPKKLNW